MALGTFKIADDRWKAFQDKARRQNTNASALLKDFIDRYLDGTQPTGESRIDRIEAAVEELRGKCHSLSNSV